MRKASLLIFILFISASMVGFAQTSESINDTATLNTVLRETEAKVAAEAEANETKSAGSDAASNSDVSYQPEMADTLRKDGKIYVVVLVLATIFAGIIAFLVRLDRKISKLEQSK